MSKSNALFIPGCGHVQMPALPKGYRAVILVVVGHSHGEAYGHRVFAVREVAHFRLPIQGCWLGKMKVFPAGTKPVVYSFLDCNAEYEFLLPKRSQEFVDGSWVSRRRAKYDY